MKETTQWSEENVFFFFDAFLYIVINARRLLQDGRNRFPGI